MWILRFFIVLYNEVIGILDNVVILNNYNGVCVWVIYKVLKWEKVIMNVK